jgi:hypothetical protein
MERQPPDPHPNTASEPSRPVTHRRTAPSFLIEPYGSTPEPAGPRLSLAMGLTLGSGLACRPGEVTSVTFIVRAELPNG